MRFWKLLLPLLTSSLCFAAQADRITGPIDSIRIVALQGNVHGLAKPEFDQGRADGSRVMSAVSIAMKPSAAQQAALETLLAQQQNRSSSNYHKWLTPAQFGQRFGLSQNDLDKVTSWLQSQGLTVTHVSNSRNQIFLQGTTAQIEAAFHTEIHNYLVDGELHYANATEPSVPAALSGMVLSVHNLHNFHPKPRVIVHRMSAEDPHFTSHLTGNHFVAPGDFATIYDVIPLYNASPAIDGTGQKIAIPGQSTINLTDVSNFRSAAGLSANVPTLTLMPGTGTATRCAGDEGESDLDVEWSGAVAKNAGITLVYAGLVAGDTCGANRQFGAFDALQYIIDQKLAPVISNSYGNCESLIGTTEANTIRGWVQQANTQGETVMSASGDSGAGDCDTGKAATSGVAVDIPAAIPEVTGMGGNEFDGDAAGTVTGGNAAATQYWAATTGGNDTISSALSYIPEMAWNDTAANDSLSASGGGASIFFSKPSWQAGTGVPNDGKRDVPDIALNASPDHDPYLFCSEDGPNNTVVASCTSGFRTGSGGDLTAVGGTSASAPTFSGLVALFNQYLGTTGLGNINPNLYGLYSSNPSAFHDVTVGNNIVPCTSGTTGCPATAPFQYGFSAGAGYDQVTGLGSVDADALAVAWAASEVPDFQLTPGLLSPNPLPAGQSASAVITLSAITGSTGRVVNFAPTSCSNLPPGATCSFNPTSVNFDGTNSVTTTVTISTAVNMTVPSGATTITITPSNSPVTTTTLSLTVTKTTDSFTLSSTAATFPISVGGTAKIPVTVVSTTGFLGTNGTTALPLTYSCSGIPASAEISCQLPGNGQPTTAGSVTVNLVTTPVTTKLMRPFGASRVFYAVVLPGLIGVVFVRRRIGGLRILSLIVALGFSTLWMGACGGSNNSNSSLTNAGTPPGNYTVTISATTGGAVPLTNSNSFSITLNVSAQ